MTGQRSSLHVRPTQPSDFAGIIALSRAVYPSSPAWSEAQLEQHLALFPEGQFVALSESDGEVVGMAASLIVLWDDYEITTSWRDFTAAGSFANHDPAAGRTLYGAEVMVHPAMQGHGVGSVLYDARRELVTRLGLLRIRAGARLRGYHRFAAQHSPAEYVERVTKGELRDPTLTFQLRRGFRVLEVVENYLRHDPESGGHAAVIEWLNENVAEAADYAHGNPRFAPAGVNRDHRH